jgi:hypothetical protein
MPCYDPVQDTAVLLEKKGAKLLCDLVTRELDTKQFEAQVEEEVLLWYIKHKQAELDFAAETHKLQAMAVHQSYLVKARTVLNLQEANNASRHPSK